MSEVRKCWYVLNAAGEIESIATSPVDEDDVKSRGGSIVASEVYEPRIDLLRGIEMGVPVYKPQVTLILSKLEDTVYQLEIVSVETAVKVVNVAIFADVFPLNVGSKTIINSVDGVPSVGVAELKPPYVVTYERRGI